MPDTEPLELSPAEEADAERILAGLAPEVDQYAGLSPLEAAAAATHPHISTCDRGETRMDCVDCADELHRIRAYIAALSIDEIRAEAYERGWKAGYGQGRDDEAAGAPVAASSTDESLEPVEAEQ